MDECKCIPSYKHSFYFTHGTFFAKNMIAILKDGFIKPNKDIDPKFRVLGGGEELDDIYGHIYFDEYPNTMPAYYEPCFILHPKILCDYGIKFYKSWGGSETIIDKNSPSKIIKKYLENIRKYLINSINKIETRPDGTKFTRLWQYRHEIRFNKKISIRKYVIGIVCDDYSCLEKDFKIIKQLIKEKNYKLTIIRRIRDKPYVNTPQYSKYIDKFFAPLPLSQILKKQKNKNNIITGYENP